LEGNTLREDELTQIEAKDTVSHARHMPCRPSAELVVRSGRIH